MIEEQHFNYYSIDNLNWEFLINSENNLINRATNNYSPNNYQGQEHNYSPNNYQEHEEVLNKYTRWRTDKNVKRLG